ncbi:MAG: hypothetical protein LUG60_03725 [Erysipelotrichaceae bacterium]|nr:hypothetical protein [Erysipelotrichaceae bacterium]
MTDINTLYQTWLKEKQKELKPLSYSKYESDFINYILPFLKEHPIETLDETIINNYFNNTLNQILSTDALQMLKVVFKSFYNYAENKGIVRHLDFSLVRHQRHIRRILLMNMKKASCLNTVQVIMKP